MTDTEPRDVLIRASVEDVHHKAVGQLAENEEAYWRVSGTPRQTEAGMTVWFADADVDGRIFAYGTITDCEDGRLWFDGAHRTDLPCLDDAPTRGFTYIDPLRPRLEVDVDEEVEA